MKQTGKIQSRTHKENKIKPPCYKIKRTCYASENNLSAFFIPLPRSCFTRLSGIRSFERVESLYAADINDTKT